MYVVWGNKDDSESSATNTSHPGRAPCALSRRSAGVGRERPVALWLRELDPGAGREDAGYTRGVIYHQFKDKEDLALAVIEWVDETWRQEVGPLVEQESDPVAALLALARGHAIYCRRDVARVAIALRLEFSGQDHPVGRQLELVSGSLHKRCARLINAGRRAGSIPAGPPARAVALAFVGAVEGAVIELAGAAPHDELLVARAAAGVLGLSCVGAAGQRSRAGATEAARRARESDLIARRAAYSVSIVVIGLRSQEVDQQPIHRIRRLELHPVPGAVEALVAPRTGDVDQPTWSSVPR